MYIAEHLHINDLSCRTSFINPSLPPKMGSSGAIPASFRVLLERSGDGLPPLRPTKLFRTDLKPEIDLLAQKHPSPVTAILHLLNDDLDSAHALAQDDDGNPSSNLIHSILHRREGDFWNSKWWLNQFQHPYLDDLYRKSDQVRSSKGKEGAKAFVDMVERVTTKGATTACAAKRDVDLAKEWQWKELRGLADYIFGQYNLSLPEPK